MHTEIATPSFPFPLRACYVLEFGSFAVLGNVGGRTANDIISWLEKRSGPPAIELPTQEEVKKLIEDKPVVVVGYFKDTESAEHKAFTAAAESEDSITFAYSTSAEVAKAMESDVPDIWLYKNVSSVLNGSYLFELKCYLCPSLTRVKFSLLGNTMLEVLWSLLIWNNCHWLPSFMTR